MEYEKCANCGGGEFWFDRTIVGPCGSMHDVCQNCGRMMPCGEDPCAATVEDSLKATQRVQESCSCGSVVFVVPAPNVRVCQSCGIATKRRIVETWNRVEEWDALGKRFQEVYPWAGSELSVLHKRLSAIFKETQLSCKVSRGTDYPAGWDDAMCCIQQILLGKMEGE